MLRTWISRGGKAFTTDLEEGGVASDRNGRGEKDKLSQFNLALRRVVSSQSGGDGARLLQINPIDTICEKTKATTMCVATSLTGEPNAKCLRLNMTLVHFVTTF